MSTYPYWSLNFALRRDIDPAVIRVLGAVARQDAPSEEDLECLHPAAQAYLGHPERLEADMAYPSQGAPLRLATDRRGWHLLSIELCQHDDEFANGGFEFWLWLLLLLEPPPTGREVIGVHGLYRRDSESVLVSVDTDGVVEGERPMVTFDEIREALHDPTM